MRVVPLSFARGLARGQMFLSHRIWVRCGWACDTSRHAVPSKMKLKVMSWKMYFAKNSAPLEKTK